VRSGLIDLHYMHLHRDQYKPTMDIETGALNPTIEQEVREWVHSSPDPSRDWLLLSINGNEHNAFTLVNFPAPFDFVDRQAPEMELIRTCRNIPYNAVLKMMEDRLHCPSDIRIKAFVLAEALARLHPRKPLWLEPPPPLEDAEYIMANPTGYESHLKELGVGPRSVALKMWRAQIQASRNLCAARNWDYIPSPQSMHNEAGFLADFACREDPTHGNLAYGAAFAEAILAYIEAHS